jgi:2-isopropylmalate synthase
VHALDRALRKALERFYPEIRRIRLVDYKVRVLNAEAATAARVRVLIQSTDGVDQWGTVGVSENVVEASWIALVDSLNYALWRSRTRVPSIPQSADA